MINTRQIIDRYFELAVQPDREAYFAQFTADAVVEDEGHEHHAIAAIRAWRTSVPAVKYTVETVEAVDDPAETTVARVDIAGDFPGSPVGLTFTFTFAPDQRISLLTIRP